ncbi:Aldehyde dehydrogenase NAD(P)-dependent, partial [Penicillium lividum]
HEGDIIRACAQGLGKPRFETEIAEIDWLLNDIMFTTRNLHEWVKDEKVPDIDLQCKLMRPKIRKDPLGCVLVIGTFNFPFQLTIGHAIDAIAAGNTVAIKPSENAPHSAVVIQKICEASLDPLCYSVVQRGVLEIQALLAERWDKSFFTGVSKTADRRLVMHRMLWGRTVNAGQPCTSQNYVLIDKSLVRRVVEEFKKADKTLYPQSAKDSPDYSRIINKGHFQRLKSLLDNSKGKILLGGTVDEKELFIEPTIFQRRASALFIPILPVENLEEAISRANRVQSTPLGLYLVSSKADVVKSISYLPLSPALDLAVSLAMPPPYTSPPFGGVGESGHGAYRGCSSFDVWVHRRPITSSPSWLEFILHIRYPPYAGKLSKLKATSTLVPDFDRRGQKLTLGWLRHILTLGGGSGKVSAGRALVITASK